MDVTSDMLGPLAAVVFVAAVVNGTAGLGFAVVTGTAVALLFDPKLAVILLSLVTPMLAAQHLYRTRAHAHVLRRIGWVLGGGVGGVLLGTQLLVLVPSFVLSLALGLFTAWYVAGSLKKEPLHLPARLERFAAPLVGVVAGVSNGSVGASGPVLGSYFMAIGLKPQEFVFAVSSFFVGLGLVRIAGLAALSQYTPVLLLSALGLYIPAHVGQRIGFWLQGRLRQSTFQRVILAVLLVASVGLVVRGIEGALANGLRVTN